MFSILTSLLRHNYDIYLLDVVTFFDNFKIALDFDTFEVSMEKKVLFLLVIVTYFYHVTITLFICSILLLVLINVRITLYFGTFELRTEITLQLHYVFARHVT